MAPPRALPPEASPMPRTSILAGLACLAVTTVVFADTVFQCTDSAGKVTWSNQPCPTNARSQAREVTPNVVDSEGLRGWAARNPARARAVPPPESSAATPTRVMDPLACDNAKRAYEFEAGYRYRKWDVLQAKAREVHEKCGYWP